MASVPEDVRKHVLQAFMGRKIMKKREYEVMCQQVCQALSIPAGRIGLPEISRSINKQLEPLGMKLQLGKMEQDGSEWIGLVNTTKDEAAKKSTLLTLPQLEFFKLAVQLITANDGSVTSDILISACDLMKRKLTKKAAQELLNVLVKDHWLYNSRGCYSIGPRSILELLPFLDEITGVQIDECRLCSTRVVMGQRCVECEKKLHIYCVAKLSKSRNGNIVKCPSCHSELTHPLQLLS